MCGICGFSGPEKKDALKKMMDSLIHRGPDQEGMYSDGSMNLGMRRLSIIDLATGQQPIHNEDRTIWCVVNGEIYNFVLLRKGLEDLGHVFYTNHSDSEVIVHLYEEYGESFVSKLNGMFAIALWDGRNQKLFLFRDRMGVKPLFYTVIGGKLVFASEIQSILVYLEFTPEINYNALYHYFSFKNICAPQTAFKDIFSLLPGETLTFENCKVERKKWWKIQFNENHAYEESYVGKNILDLLEDSVRLRMISDVPVGAYLSGGVDSSAVVALMTKFATKPVKTFTLGYKDDLKNKAADLYFARKVSKFFNTEHYEYIMDSNELLEEINNVTEAFDQPFSGTISTYFLSKLIKQHVKVALSGDGADELFGSYLSHRVAAPMYHYARFGQKTANEMTKSQKQLLEPVDIDYLRTLFEETQGNEAAWRQQLTVFPDESRAALFSSRFKECLTGITAKSYLEDQFSRLTAKNPLNRVLEMEWNTIFPDQVLSFMDLLSMAHSIELRSPFLDYRLVEFAATIPGSMKIKGGNVKHILKKAVEPVLPKGIVERPKEGFVLPVFQWMSVKLEGYCREMLSSEKMKKHGLFNQLTVDKLLDSYYGGHSELAAKVWNLVMFQVWWERYYG